MAFPAASRLGALPRQDAGLVAQFSRCCCHTCVLLHVATGRGSCVKMLLPQNAGFGHAGIFGLETCEISASECGGSRLCCHRPRPGLLLFLSLRLLRCRLVSVTSVLKDSVSAAHSSSNKPPICLRPAPMSSLLELLELHDSIPRGAGSPEASPVSSSLSMGTIPRNDKSALVSSDSDPEPPLNPTVDSDPDDDCCVTCWERSTCLPLMPAPHAFPSSTCLPSPIHSPPHYRTLTGAGTCSHLTSLAGVAISRSSISQTGLDLQLTGCGCPSL